ARTLAEPLGLGVGAGSGLVGGRRSSRGAETVPAASLQLDPRGSRGERTGRGEAGRGRGVVSMPFLRAGSRGRRRVLLLGVVGLAVSSCGPRRPAIRSVLLISIDTLRADHVGSYGFPRPATPHIDAIAREGVLFANVYSPVPVTLPAHCSMLTGT